MDSQLISKLRTKDDLDILRGELDILENALYQSGNKYEQILRTDIRNWVTEIILKETTKEKIGEYIKTVKAGLDAVPIVSASINFEPSEAFLEQISSWFKKNVNENIVIDMLLNTGSLGGIQMSYNGKYVDLSLRKKVSMELEKMQLTQ